jgi:hypothetical protein
MGIKRMVSGNWFTRLALATTIACAVSVYFLFKNMESIVHGQLYYYGLTFSPDWADPYRVYTWLIYLCLGMPMALCGLAIVTSFLKTGKAPEKKDVVPTRLPQQPQVAKAPPRQIVAEEPKKVEKGNSGVNGDGIPCPHCGRVFGRALVMLDFHGGKKRLVSVCPYCNHVVGKTTDANGANENFHVTFLDEKIVR